MSAPEKMSEGQIEDCIDEANRLFNGRRHGPCGQQITTYDDWKHWLARAIEAARDAQWQARLDKLTAENENLRSVMIAAAEEIHEHWQAHCDDDGYGPANLMRRLEKGIPAEYAYKAGDFERLMQERAALAAEVDRLQSMLNNADCEWQARLDAAVKMSDVA
jgi:chromosome segregation ATPase